MPPTTMRGTELIPFHRGLDKVSGMNTLTYSILITDDDCGSRDALRDIVEPEGYRTYLASSGEEALDIVRNEKVHLALLDMHMPRLSGLETVELVHQIDEFLPCILVTGNATQDVVRQAFTVRAYSVIPKPVSKSVLLYTVVRALMKAYGNLLQKGQDHS
jgi:two-component system chemotaxis response regulator CheY